MNFDILYEEREKERKRERETDRQRQTERELIEIWKESQI